MKIPTSRRLFVLCFGCGLAITLVSSCVGPRSPASIHDDVQFARREILAIRELYSTKETERLTQVKLLTSHAANEERLARAAMGDRASFRAIEVSLELLQAELRRYYLVSPRPIHGSEMPDVPRTVNRVSAQLGLASDFKEAGDPESLDLAARLFVDVYRRGRLELDPLTRKGAVLALLSSAEIYDSLDRMPELHWVCGRLLLEIEGVRSYGWVSAFEHHSLRLPEDWQTRSIELQTQIVTMGARYRQVVQGYRKSRNEAICNGISIRHHVNRANAIAREQEQLIVRLGGFRPFLIKVATEITDALHLSSDQRGAYVALWGDVCLTLELIEL